MPIRRISRILFSIVVLAGLWYRLWQEWASRTALWIVGSSLLSLMLILVVIVEATGMQQKWKRQRDEVSKRPLGLDA